MALSQPGDVLFNGTGRKLAGTRVGTSLIDSFIVGGDGHLTAAPGSPFAAQGLQGLPPDVLEKVKARLERRRESPLPALFA